MKLAESWRRVRLGAAEMIFGALDKSSSRSEADPMQSEKTAGTIYGFNMRTIDGKNRALADYKGFPLLIVNTASLCGFTPQYKDLEDLYKRCAPRGLKIAAFPANEFGAQEPGPDEQIKSFCLTKYAISFDLYSKIAVKGPNIHPLYRYLTAESGFPGEIPWNFSKFLVDRKGKVVARFGPDSNPVGPEIMAAVEKVLT